MSPINSRVVGVLFIGVVMCGSAMADSVFSSNKETSPADAASKLLVDPDAPAETGLSDSLDETAGDSMEKVQEQPGGQVIEAPVLSIPNANPVSLLNCSGKKVTVKAYNSNDAVVIVPYEAKTIANGAAASLKCKTKSCKLRVGTGKAMGPISGYLKLGSGISTSSKSALEAGC